MTIGDGDGGGGEIATGGGDAVSGRSDRCSPVSSFSPGSTLT